MTEQRLIDIDLDARNVSDHLTKEKQDGTALIYMRNDNRKIALSLSGSVDSFTQTLYSVCKENKFFESALRNCAMNLALEHMKESLMATESKDRSIIDLLKKN